MIALRSLFALSCTMYFAVPLLAADLSKIERAIHKEPVYQLKPRYCLLVLGADAKTRGWLALDGNRLYVDRNGNGDLTDPGEVITAQGGDEADEPTFSAGEIFAGEVRYKNLTVRMVKLERLAIADEQIKEILGKNPHGIGYASVSIEMEMRSHKVVSVFAGQDVAGVLQFADRPNEAPIINFGGPWQLSLFGRQRLTVGRETDLILGIGTRGVGPGSTAYVGYEGLVPESAYPVAEITYAPGHKGKPLIRKRYELKQRC
jgi:hypothetical protein